MAASAAAGELPKQIPTTIGNRACASGDWCLTINFVTIEGVAGSIALAAESQKACEGTAQQITAKLALPDRHRGPHARDTGATCVQTP